MKCTHENCGGELQYRQDSEEKGRFGVFECNKCHCKFGVISIRKEVGCPSLKEKTKTESLSTTDASIKRKRGRPRNARNKVPT